MLRFMRPYVISLFALLLAGCVPSNALSISNMELSGGRYTASIPFLSEQRGVYNVYLLRESSSDQAKAIPIEGSYKLQNDAGEELLSGKFQAQLSTDNRQSLVTAFSLTRDRAIEAYALVIEIDIGSEELRQNSSRIAIQLEKKGHVVFLD